MFHLEAPAATVVIRTFTEDLGQPQYTYRLPSVAYDPFHGEPQVTRQLQVLGLLRETRPEVGIVLAAEPAGAHRPPHRVAGPRRVAAGPGTPPRGRRPCSRPRAVATAGPSTSSPQSSPRIAAGATSAACAAR